MYRKFKISAVAAIILIMVSACNNSPKVITSTNEDESATKSSGIFTESNNKESKVDFNTPLADGLHKIEVIEALPASKYVYLSVKEGDKQYWVATPKKEIKAGEIYYFRNGLLKTNYESKEYNRVFETMYLVTNLVAEKHGGGNPNDLIANNSNKEPEVKMKESTQKGSVKSGSQESSIKISELVADPKKYEGQTVQITGTCTKINAGIMNRNWIHLQDGSKDDYDLVITSSEFVPEGSTVTMKAIVTLNKDFGAGYMYELILENGVVVK